MKTTTFTEPFTVFQRYIPWALSYAILTALSLLQTAHGGSQTWRGSATDNIWRVSGGEAVWAPGNGKGNGLKIFETGADITFNTSTTVTNVAVSGTVAPSTLTISSGASYSFTPLTGGSIQATGAVNISGTLTLGATSSINTSTLPLLTTSSNNGITVNNGGSLILAGTGNHLGNDTNLQLSGGRLAITGSGVSETFGALTLTSPSTLDFSGSGSSLSFTSISGSGVLNIFNFDPNDRLYLAQPPSAAINFYSGSDINSPRVSYTAEVVPEPSTILAGLGLVGFLGWRERRRISSFLKREKPEEAIAIS